MLLFISRHHIEAEFKTVASVNFILRKDIGTAACSARSSCETVNIYIDNFIRAKGAIYSGIDTLLQSVDMTPECIDRVVVAGGIGSGINMRNAINIGMLPDVELEKYQYIGNSSLTGAYTMVVSDEAVAKCAEVAQI